MPKNQDKLDKNALPFIIVVVLVLGILLGYLSTTIINNANLGTNGINFTGNSSATYYDQSYIDEIYKTLNETYLGNIPSRDELTEGMVKGLIESLKDPYTTFLTQQEAEAYNTSKDPDFEGIGVSLKFDGENTLVESVLEGNPAQSAGIMSGDVIAEVDGESTLGFSPTQVASKIRGEKGTKVALKVYRINESSQSDLIEFEIPRARIDIDNISYKNLGEGYFKINISQFTDTSAEALNASWNKVVGSILSENSNPRGIVIDLRNNPGGYVYSLRYILEEFFQNGAILMKEEKKDTQEIVYRDQRTGKFENTPISVLVNEGSASASEIFAAAVQDNDRGEVIGMKTVGKGVEQTLVQREDGSMLILVFQKWLTPNGKHISAEEPITPDFEIDYTNDDVKAGKDPQLDKGLEQLKN